MFNSYKFTVNTSLTQTFLLIHELACDLDIHITISRHSLRQVDDIYEIDLYITVFEEHNLLLDTLTTDKYITIKDIVYQSIINNKQLKRAS